MISEDFKALSKVISREYGDVKVRRKYGWQNSSLNTIDCVLSLNRKYKGFVLPRVMEFQNKHPRMNDLEGLKRLIKRYEHPKDFLIDNLNYNDEKRSIVLLEVIKYLLFEQKYYSGTTQYKRIQKWAKSVRPGDAYFTGINGFGLSGFQYMRMLFGAQTVKPDVHIKNYISTVLNRKVNDAFSLVLLEKVGKSLKIPLRELDNAIWKDLSNKNRTIS